MATVHPTQNEEAPMELGPTSQGTGRVRRSHPADVTADRLGDHYEKWNAKFDGEELDAISIVRNALQEIAEGAR